MPPSPFPAYAGIPDVFRVGLGVDQCAAFVARFAAFKRESARLLAAHLTALPEWELKAAAGRWLWEDALHFRDLERRLRELRSNSSAITRVLQYEAGDFLAELLHAPDSLALFTGYFDVMGPALLRAIESYLAQTQPLVDQPTVRLLESLRHDERARQQTGAACLEALTVTDEDRKRRADWQDHFARFLAKAGGVLGSEPVPPLPGTLKPRASEEYRMAREFARDRRFTTTVPKIPPAQFEHDELRRMMWVRAQEMTAAEMLASVLYEWEDLPTDGFVDIARHLWDEVRHALFGQAALEADGIPLTSLPSWVGYAFHTLPAPPVKRYAHLAIATEAGGMAYPGGKRGEWEFARDQARHPLMATFQDFDWADEVTHVNHGRRWIIEHHFKGDREAARKLADETVAERKAFYAQYETAPEPKVGEY